MASPTSPPQRSSLTSGFFQALPQVLPQYTAASQTSTSRITNHDDRSDDPIPPRLLRLYLPFPIPDHISNHLHSFARLVLHPTTLSYTVDADTNPPTLHPLTTFGTPNLTDPLHTSPGWKNLKRIETANGVVGHGYPQPTFQANSTDRTPYNRRIQQFANLHLWGGSAAVATCPMAMTDGAAVLLRQQLASTDLDVRPRKVFQDAYDRLISLDPDFAWTSGQWMTERSGGSDVRGTETVARLITAQEIEEDRRRGVDKDSIGNDLGEWRVDGFKWFSSATDADMCVLLAQTDRGLSAFFAPLRRRVPISQSGAGVSIGDQAWTTHMNGVYLSRLKNKLGTKAVPTAELEIRGMRAYLVGKPGQGIKMISSLLNVTRIWTASGAVSGWARGLAISRAFTRVRKVKGGKLLSENKQHVRWMADETVGYRAMTSLYMFGVALLGHAEDPRGSRGTKAMELGLLPDTREETEMLLRLLTPLMKMCCSLASVAGLRACMESLGGVGYCENNEDGGVLNIARLFRDANVNPIWEGTGSVLAEDLLRALRAGKNDVGQVLEKTFGKWFSGVTMSMKKMQPRFQEMLRVVRERYEKVKELLETKSEDELLWQGRVIVGHFEAIVCAVLLLADTCVDGDEVATAVAQRWIRMKVKEGPKEEVGGWEKEAALDRRIFLGNYDGRPKSSTKL